MDKKTERILNIFTYMFLAFVMIFILFKSGNSTVLVPLFVLLTMSIFLRQNFLHKEGEKNTLSKFLLFIDSALVYWIIFYDQSGLGLIIIYILIGEAIILYSFKYSLFFTLINFVSFAIIVYLELGYPTLSKFISKTISALLGFAFVYGFMFIAKYQIIQSEKLNETKKELENKSKELELAYKKLQETFNELEDITILKERNRIAGEIHDTVGHTLTTVLVEIEAGKRLMKKDMDLAEKKLNLAQGQVRKGLNDIRKSVRTLKDGEEVLDFISSINALINETEKHGDVKINSLISKIPELNRDIEKALYRALQEGITNGIRHGKSYEFDFTLQWVEDRIQFYLQDYGQGCENIKYGFGLTNMKCRMEQLGGILEVNSNSNGCVIVIKIPLNKESA